MICLTQWIIVIKYIVSEERKRHIDLLRAEALARHSENRDCNATLYYVWQIIVVSAERQYYFECLKQDAIRSHFCLDDPFWWQEVKFINSCRTHLQHNPIFPLDTCDCGSCKFYKRRDWDRSCMHYDGFIFYALPCPFLHTLYFDERK